MVFLIPIELRCTVNHTSNLEKLQTDEYCKQLHVLQHIIRMHSSIARATTLVCMYDDTQQATCRLTAVLTIWLGEKLCNDVTEMRENRGGVGAVVT